MKTDWRAGARWRLSDSDGHELLVWVEYEWLASGRDFNVTWTATGGRRYRSDDDMVLVETVDGTLVCPDTGATYTGWRGEPAISKAARLLS